MPLPALAAEGFLFCGCPCVTVW